MPCYKPFYTVYDFHCCMCLVGEIDLKFLFGCLLNLIWVCKKDTTWKSLSEYIYLETWIYLIRIFSRPLLFNTTFYQTFLFDKIIKTEALCDLLLDAGSAFTHIIRHMSMGDHNTSHPAMECLVLAHFGPVYQESIVRTSPAVRSSELGIHYMTLTTVRQLHVWCQKWNTFDLSLLLTTHLQIYLYMSINGFSLKQENI